MTWLIASTIKMSVVLGIGLIAASASRRGAAALRHWIIAASLLSAALVPIVGLIGPAWNIPVGQRMAAGQMQFDAAVESGPAPARIPGDPPCPQRAVQRDSAR